MSTKKDSYYIERILSGYASDFSIIVDKYKDMVYTVAYRISGNHEDAEELAQDVFVKAYNSLKDFKGKSKLSTWLYSITYNTSISKIRKKRLDYISLDEDDISYSEIENKSYEEKFDFDRVPLNILKKVMNKLDPVDKLMLTLYYQDDRTINELSDITGLTAANVKVRLFRSRKKIYTKLKEVLK
jgi:RNA polymerase sigma factor (sigma-70 family)